jgi:hypothetical protein
MFTLGEIRDTTENIIRGKQEKKTQAKIAESSKPKPMMPPNTR